MSEKPEPMRHSCPPTWDGWQCWPDGGDPGHVEYQPCPSHIYFHSGGSSGVGKTNLMEQYQCGRKLNFPAINHCHTKKLFQYWLNCRDKNE